MTVSEMYRIRHGHAESIAPFYDESWIAFDNFGSQRRCGVVRIGHANRGKLSGAATVAALAIISMLFSTACSINLGGQARDGYQAQGSNRVRNQSIPLETTTANHGKRCEDREYLYEAPDEPEADSIRYGECYRLQKQLVSAALEGDVATMADALKHGASPEGTYYASFPPLHTAARFGHAEAVRLLLDNGADVNRVSGVDSTALGAAATGGHVEVIRILIEYGADVNYRNYGGTAEDNARRSGHTQAADLLSEARRCSVPTPE